uniref:uncharacterized protein LOC120345605 n=1 Tax=Styela clava TaxID=7725 RepID=UPI00193A4DB5|nr:uncharacterized protein LOC120345605 [Styela clava]
MEAHAIACGLSPDFVRRIQDARIEIEDLPLNLQEVYGLFSDLPFRDRRMLQECLCQPPKTTPQQRGEMLDLLYSSDDTLPVLDLCSDNPEQNSSEGSNFTPPTPIPAIDEQFHQSTSTPAKPDNIEIPSSSPIHYPSPIPTPFPICTDFKNCLNSAQSPLSKALYLAVNKTYIFHMLSINDRKPNRQERLGIAQNLG